MKQGMSCMPALKQAFEVMVLLAAAAMMTAVMVDIARSAETAPAKAVEREVIPGADRMSGAEREIYRRRINAAATPEEKARIRAEYVKAENGPAPARPLVAVRPHCVRRQA